MCYVPRVDTCLSLPGTAQSNQTKLHLSLSLSLLFGRCDWHLHGPPDQPPSCPMRFKLGRTATFFPMIRLAVSEIHCQTERRVTSFRDFLLKNPMILSSSSSSRCRKNNSSPLKPQRKTETDVKWLQLCGKIASDARLNAVERERRTEARNSTFRWFTAIRKRRRWAAEIFCRCRFHVSKLAGVKCALLYNETNEAA